jgi:hypothetical protein
MIIAAHRKLAVAPPASLLPAIHRWAAAGAIRRDSHLQVALHRGRMTARLVRGTESLESFAA